MDRFVRSIQLDLISEQPATSRARVNLLSEVDETVIDSRDLLVPTS
jgi:hypothetical protein